MPVIHRDVQFSCTFELGVDPVSGDGGFDVVEVLPAEPFERVELVREPVQAVGFAVGQAAGTEAAVAAGRGPADGRRFDQDDVAAGIGLLGLQCGPQTGVTAADDDQIGIDCTDSEGNAGGAAGSSSQNTEGWASANERIARGVQVGSLPSACAFRPRRAGMP
jgi:hypothetical protein